MRAAHLLGFTNSSFFPYASSLYCHCEESPNAFGDDAPARCSASARKRGNLYYPASKNIFGRKKRLPLGREPFDVEKRNAELLEAERLRPAFIGARNDLTEEKFNYIARIRAG